MIIEYGHIYIADLESGSVDYLGIEKSIEIAQKSKSDGDLLVVLIDDKDYSLSNSQKDHYAKSVESLYDSMGLRPDLIHFEKEFSASAIGFIEKLPKENLKVESFRKQKKKVTFLKNGSQLIPLMSEKDAVISFSCQLLSSLWRQKKENLALGLLKSKTLTILDQKFKAVEDDVAYLNRLVPSSAHIQHEYLWY